MDRLPCVLLVVGLVALAGCTAKGADDPFAYTKKPLYTGHFDLAAVGADGATQEFRVQDGSIASVRVLVWVNATLGGARVEITDPHGSTVISTTQTTDQAAPLKLGAWRVTVTGLPEGETLPEGSVGILVVRG